MTPRRLSFPALGLAFLRHAGLVFGGAVSIGPSLEAELVGRRRAIGRDEFWLTYGLSQMMPSIILGNLAISLGYRLRGPLGAVAALAGLLIPSFAVAMALTLLFLANRDLTVVQTAMRTTLPAVIGVVAVAAYKLARHHVRTAEGRRRRLAVMALVAIGLIAGVSPLLLLGLAGAAGILYMRPPHAA